MITTDGPSAAAVADDTSPADGMRPGCTIRATVADEPEQSSGIAAPKCGEFASTNLQSA